MTETNKQFDYPADGSDSILPSPGSLKNTPGEQLDRNVEMIRRIRAGEPLGDIALTNEAIEVTEVEPRVEKRSLGGRYGH